MTAPGSLAISQAVANGLGVNGFLSPAVVPNVTFGPTLGIAAGRIDKLGVDIRSFRVPLLRAIREVMVPSIRRNFDEGGRPDKWEPLSAYTVKIRGNAGPILIRTKRLMQVATQINIWDVTSTNAVIRDLPEEVWYGKVHQEGYESGHPSLMASLIKKYSGDLMAANKEFTKTVGSGIGAPTIPARPFFVFQPEDEAAIDEIFIRWLAERVEQAWPS